MSADIKERINIIQSALAGAANEVYEFVAKLVHTESKIALFDLPCCKQPIYVSPSKVTVNAKPALSSTQPALWVKISEVMVAARAVKHPIAKLIANGAHIKYKLSECNTINSGVIVKHSKFCTVLNEAGYVQFVDYSQITDIDANSYGTPSLHPAAYKAHMKHLKLHLLEKTEKTNPITG